MTTDEPSAPAGFTSENRQRKAPTIELTATEVQSAANHTTELDLAPAKLSFLKMGQPVDKGAKARPPRKLGPPPKVRGTGIMAPRSGSRQLRARRPVPVFPCCFWSPTPSAPRQWT